MTITETSETERHAGFQWDRLTYAAALGYCLLVGALSVSAVLAELREQFQLSGFVAALHGSMFGFGLLLAGFWGVAVVARWGRRGTLRLAAAAMITGVALFCVGQAWTLTLLGAAIAGVGAATLVMVMPGLISDHHGEHRDAAFAAANAAPGLAGVAYALVVSAALSAGWSWRGPYLGLTLAIAVVFVIAARHVRVPEPTTTVRFTTRHLRDRHVLVPWLHIVNGVFADFTVGVWTVTYLKEVGGASSGSAPAFAAVFGIMMFTSRMILPRVQSVLADWTVVVCFLAAGSGAAIMCFAPSLPTKVIGLIVVALGAGPLYPLTVSRFYAATEGEIDGVSLGALSAIASGVAITVGPLAVGVIADLVDLKWAILIVSAVALLGAITQRPTRSSRSSRGS